MTIFCSKVHQHLSTSLQHQSWLIRRVLAHSSPKLKWTISMIGRVIRKWCMISSLKINSWLTMKENSLQMSSLVRLNKMVKQALFLTDIVESYMLSQKSLSQILDQQCPWKTTQELALKTNSQTKKYRYAHQKRNLNTITVLTNSICKEYRWFLFQIMKSTTLPQWHQEATNKWISRKVPLWTTPLVTRVHKDSTNI